MQPLSKATSMSLTGHKRRFERASAVSALPSFATKSVRAPSAGLGQQATQRDAFNTVMRYTGRLALSKPSIRCSK